MKTLKFKLGLIISTIMTIVFIIVLLYYNSILNNRAISSSVQILTNLGIEHESILKNEIENTKAKSDILALFFANNIKDDKLSNNSYKILSSVLENSPNIHSLTIAHVGQLATPNSFLDTKQSSNQKMNYLTVSKSKKGIITSTMPLDDDLKVALLKKELANNTLKHVFEPTENTDVGFLIPIVTPIFSGQKYLGYIQANVSLNWFSNEINLDGKFKTIEILFTKSNGEIVASNNKKFTIGDKISSICPNCKIANSNSFKNYTETYSKLIYCRPVLFDKQQVNWQICYKTDKDLIFEIVGYNFWNHFLIGLFLLIISIVLIIVFIDYLTRPFKMLIEFAQKVALGDFKYEQGDIETVRKDEIGQLQTAFRGISKALEETAEVSNAIASGDFSKTIKLKSDEDLLASSINRMNSFLKKKEEQEQISKLDDEKQKWFNDGISLMSKVLKANQDNTEVLADKIIKNLVHFLDISLGGIYIKEQTKDEKEIYRLIAAYAYSEQKFIDKQFESGESLVGSCASEKRTVYMSSVPEEYIKIFSGLGESAPKGLLLIPIIYNDEVFGVLELASLKEITKFEQKFLQEVSDNIASTLSLTQISSQTADLLEKSRIQASELEKHDMEMNKTLDKLQKLQKETAKREVEVRSKITAMNNSLLVVEYTTDGTVLDANQKYLSLMNFTIDEVKGVNVFDLLQEKEKKGLSDIINTVKKGNFYEAVVKRHTKHDKEKWLLATYTPVLDESGTTSSILFFATDITRTAAKEQRLQKQLNELKSDSEISTASETEIIELHVKQQEKITELIQIHKVEQDRLSERIDKQKTEDSNTISSYEKMISEIVNQWSEHIDEAEKVIKKK